MDYLYVLVYIYILVHLKTLSGTHKNLYSLYYSPTNFRIFSGAPSRGKFIRSRTSSIDNSK